MRLNTCTLKIILKMDERTWRNWWKTLPCLLLYCLCFPIHFMFSLLHDPHFFIFSFILLFRSSSSVYFYYTSDIFNSLHLFIVQLKWDFLWIFEMIHICIKSKWICTLTYYLQFPLLISSTQEGILFTINEDAFKTIVRYLKILCKVSLNSPCMTICQTNYFSEFPLWNLLIGIHGSHGTSTMRTVIQPPAISTEEVTMALSLSFSPTTWYNSFPFLTTHNKAVVLTSAQLTVKETREMKGDTKQI